MVTSEKSGARKAWKRMPKLYMKREWHREASRMFNVPLKNQRRCIIGMVEINTKPGPSTVLSVKEEDCLAKYVVDMADMGSRVFHCALHVET